MLKLAIITSFLSKTKDRFHEYNEPLDLEQKFKMITKIEGATGVEAVFPYEVTDAATTKSLADKYRLKFAAINVNVKAEPEFRNGGLTSPDKAVRGNAVRLIKQAKDFAEQVGADKVTCCPLGDGYEFSFQSDYAVIWKHLIETFGEAAEYKKNIPLFIEFKPSETRGTCYLNNTSKTLLLIKQIGVKELGITLDFGHAMYGATTRPRNWYCLPKAVQHYYIHINDNDGKWDWDYFCGTKHLLEYVEFLYYLRKYKYDDFMTSDTSPTRWDIRGTFAANNRLTLKIWQLFDQIELARLGSLMATGDYLETWKFIEQNIFSLK